MSQSTRKPWVRIQLLFSSSVANSLGHEQNKMKLDLSSPCLFQSNRKNNLIPAPTGSNNCTHTIECDEHTVTIYIVTSRWCYASSSRQASPMPNQPQAMTCCKTNIRRMTSLGLALKTALRRFEPPAVVATDCCVSSPGPGWRWTVGASARFGLESPDPRSKPTETSNPGRWKASGIFRVSPILDGMSSCILRSF